MIFDRLMKVFTNTLPYAKTDSITTESSLRYDLHIDSVSLLLLVLGIEDEFGIRFDNMESDAFETVGDVVRYIETALL